MRSYSYLLPLTVLLFIGCSKNIYNPTSVTKPTLEEVPELTLVDRVKAPENESLTLSFVIEDQPKPTSGRDYFNKPGVYRSDDGRAPSVLIISPSDINIETTSSQSTDQLKNNSDDEFNKAERAIVKALLMRGFDILDKSKFEAKLRTVRQSGDFELNDIAEVFRAFESGDKADYLLKVFEISVNDAGNRPIITKDYAEVERFVKQHPNLTYGDSTYNIPTKINSRWLRATFIADLIEVETGKVVWTGDYEIESSAAEPIEIILNVEKKITNEEALNSQISAYNNQITDAKNNLTKYNEDYNGLLNKSNATKEFETPEELTRYTSDMNTAFASLSEKYEVEYTRYMNLLNNPFESDNVQWEYDYVVSAPIFNPNLLVMGASTLDQQNLLNHRKKLIEKITEELIKTISIE